MIINCSHLKNAIGKRGVALSLYQSPACMWEGETRQLLFYIKHIGAILPALLKMLVLFFFKKKNPIRKNLDIPLPKCTWLATAWELIWLEKLGQGHRALEE